jgi:hypothetical protein
MAEDPPGPQGTVSRERDQKACTVLKGRGSSVVSARDRTKTVQALAAVERAAKYAQMSMFSEHATAKNNRLTTLIP